MKKMKGWTVLALIFLTAGCARNVSMVREDGYLGTRTWIDAPLHGSVIPLQPYEIVFHVSDSAGIAQAECSINNGGAMRFTGSVDESTWIQTFQHMWDPPEPGLYLIACRGQNSDGNWSAPAEAQVRVQGEETSEPVEDTPGTNTPGATASPTAPEAEADCVYDVDYLADVTIPEGTVMDPGESFQKTWRFANAGTCPIDGSFEFAYFGADRLGGPWQVSAPEVAPGEEFDMTLSFTAPSQPGQHESVYRFRTPDGEWFGSRPFVRIVVEGSPPVTGTPEPACILNSPNPYLPGNGAEGTSQNVTLNWSYGASGCVPDGYRVRLSPKSDFSSQVTRVDVSGMSYETDTLITCVTYHWQVRALHDDDKGPWSAVYQFTVNCPIR